MRKVVVWGAYNYGNFGDDLMALLFAKVLRDEGWHPIVHRLDPSVAAAAGVDSEASLTRALDGACACVVGGGALLSDYDLRIPVLRRHEDDVCELAQVIREKRLPLFISSVGGSGLEGEAFTPAVRELLTAPSLKSVTVRLETDVNRLAKIGVCSSYFPDVVTLAGQYFGGRGRGARDWVGVHLPAMLATRSFVRVLPLWLRANGIGAQIKAFGTYLDSRWHLVAETGTKAELSSILPDSSRYTSVSQVLNDLARCRVIVSYKLHLGVSALSVSTPFISYAGKGKTVGFMRELGASEFCFERNQIWGLLSALRRCDKLSVPRGFSELAMAASGHIEVLRHSLNLLASSPLAD